MEINGRKIKNEVRPLPPHELVVTPESLERLKIPDEIALKPENVLPFLANQSLRYNEIVNRPEIKALEGDIPLYIHDDVATANVKSNFSAEEQSVLDDWGRGVMLRVQSDPDIDPLLNQIDKAIEEAAKNHPELETFKPGTSFDFLDDMMIHKLTQETEAERQRFREALAMAASSGNPEAVSTVLGFRYAFQASKKIGKLMEVYRYNVDAMDKLRATFDLENRKGDPSAADLAMFNADFARQQSDVSNLFQMVTMAMNDYQRISEFTHTINGEIRRPLEVMIQNMKS